MNGLESYYPDVFVSIPNSSLFNDSLEPDQSPATGKVVWLYGPSGAGKTTLSRALSADLKAVGINAFILDGDCLRAGLCRDLGFSADDRAENIRRAAEVARLVSVTGQWVVAAFITPLRVHRESVRSIVGDSVLIEAFVNCPIYVCEERDPKGLYKRFRNGDIAGMIGLDSIFESPVSPEIEVRTDECSVQVARQMLLKKVLERADDRNQN